jgi:uncharacterized protein YbaR (Trm112 family)
MAVPDSLLTLLRCPKSLLPLRWASPEESGVLGEKWNRSNNPVAPTGFLISADNRWAYPERDGVPCLLLDEAIAL